MMLIMQRHMSTPKPLLLKCLTVREEARRGRGKWRLWGVQTVVQVGPCCRRVAGSGGAGRLTFGDHLVEQPLELIYAYLLVLGRGTVNPSAAGSPAAATEPPAPALSPHLSSCH